MAIVGIVVSHWILSRAFARIVQWLTAGFLVLFFYEKLAEGYGFENPVLASLLQGVEAGIASVSLIVLFLASVGLVLDIIHVMLSKSGYLAILKSVSLWSVLIYLFTIIFLAR